MNRLMLMVCCALACALLCVPASADDPPKKLTPEERKELDVEWDKFMAAGTRAYRAGKYADSIEPYEGALKVARKLYNAAEFPDGHNNLGINLTNLGLMYANQGRYADAEPLYKEALEMLKRLFKGQDHRGRAITMGNLGHLYAEQGRYADAEPLYKEALEMLKRLFKDQDQPDLARALNNLASLYSVQGRYADAEPLSKEAVGVYRRLAGGKDHLGLTGGLDVLALVYEAQGRYVDAEPLYKEAVEMLRRLFKGQDRPELARALNNLANLYESQDKGAAAEPLYKEAVEVGRGLAGGKDHPDLAMILSNLGGVYSTQGRYAEAEPRLKEALEMMKRLHKGDHPSVAVGLNNLAGLYRGLGKLDAAETLFQESLEMKKRLYTGDHPALATGLNNLGFLHSAQRKYAAAAPLYTGALAMKRRLITAFAQDKTEGEALTLLASQSLTRDGFLSNEQARVAAPAGVYSQLWADKGYIARAYERRQLQARAAATDPRAATMLGELTDARRRRAELLLAPAPKDPATLKKRDADLTAADARVEQLTRDLKALLPALERAQKLATADSAALQKVLPDDGAVVDFLRFTHFQHDKPGKEDERQVLRYLAFVVTKEKIAWVDLGTAAKIESAIDAWRAAITSGKEIPSAIPGKVRELVWEKVRKELPANIKTLYVCPDAALCKVPFAALPGDKPGTVLLEDFAVATIPHTPFLLDKLWAQDPLKNPPTGALVVGAVKYDAEVTDKAATGSAGPLVKPDQELGWSFLANTVGEANGVCATAERKKIAATRIEGAKATSAAVLSALPRARYAHFATHGFFADASFRSIFQLDEKDFAMREGERIGRVANSPLVMTGLVFAGANNPKTPGRGIITGESLIDLDLSGLELAVLSACETGVGDVGDVAGGEGTYALQRAFHYAGTRDVVASLWKVPDRATAALMGEFYRNLWEKNLTPMESLRQAQLTIYRNPGKIGELAEGFRGPLKVVPGKDADAEPPAVGGKAHPRLWAAFTLSGPGR